MGRDVAGHPRVPVVLPGAPDAVGLLQDDQVVVAAVQELLGHAEARRPRAHDDDAPFGGPLGQGHRRREELFIA